MRRAVLATLFALLAVGAGAVAGALWELPRTEPNDVAALAPGVYFRHGDLDGHGHCNNGFVVFEDFVVVVDANFPDGATAAYADIRKRTQHPVRFVFDTHHHGDHAYGNAVWRKLGALPIATEKVRGELARYEPKRWQEAASSREDVRELGLETAMPPVLTFPERLLIDDGKRRAELLHFGTAHTRGDGFLYLPHEKILFTGDAVVNGPYNYMGDGDTGSWLEVIDHLLELDVEIVAPGHGACADRSLLQDQREYIAGLRQAVREGIAAGQTLETLQRSIEVPARVARYKGNMFPDQVAKIWTEMKARAAPADDEADEDSKR